MVVSKVSKMNDEKCSQIGTLVIHPSVQNISYLKWDVKREKLAIKLTKCCGKQKGSASRL